MVSAAAPRPIRVSREETGQNSSMKKRREGAVALHSRSGYFLAMLLGSISPAKKTTMVVTMVLMLTAFRPQSLVTATVTREAAAMCTMLVPISRVLMARSK